MNMVYKSIGYIRHLYNQVNPATLTGAIDILVVEQPDGSLVASPFHVRFGKLGVLRAKEKMVKISINEEKIQGLHMKLGDQGEAFFLEECDDEDAIPFEMITSPLPSRPSTPTDSKLAMDEFDDEVQPSIQSLDENAKRRRRKKRKRRSFLIPSSNVSNAEDKAAKADSSSEEEEDVVFNPSPEENGARDVAARSMSVESNDTYTLAATCAPSLRLSTYNDSGSSSEASIVIDSSDDSNAEFNPMRCVQSDSELPMLSKDELRMSQTPFSDSETTESRPGPGLMWGWGKLPARNEEGRDSSSDEPSNNEKRADERNDVGEFRTVDLRTLPGQDTVHVEDETAAATTQTSSAPTSQTAASSRQRKDTEGLYLDDVLSLEPSEANLYLQKATRNSAQAPGHAEALERATSPAGCSDIDSGTDCQNQDDQNDVIDDGCEVALSLCGFLSGTSNVDKDKFDEMQITYDAFLADALAIVNDPNLVIKLGESRYLNWQSAAPFIMSLAVFARPLSPESLERVIQSTQPSQTHSKWAGWFWRRQSRIDQASTSDTPSVPSSPSKTDVKHDPLVKSASLATRTISPSLAALNGRDRRQTEGDVSTSIENELADIMEHGRSRSHSSRDIFQSSDGDLLTSSASGAHALGKAMRKTTRLSSEQLKKLCLEPGANTITFSVTSQYQGTTRCSATVFLWRWSDRIVVSDIDGTITKSDVFGQILPVVGKDWTQGGVAQLYQNISQNGYKFMYVSARAIGQASMTKGYLNWINQQGVSLPPGPLLLSPTSLVVAFRREVIEKKPEKFKIECLRDIKALFPENPFVAGFGNKANDVFAYSAVGVPNNRMFTINHKGELKHEQLPTYTTSYSGLGELVDNYFPALHKEQDFIEADQFSDFTYWRDSIAELDDFELA